MVSFTQAIKNTLTYCDHFNFKGRSCRSEFWWSWLGFLLIAIGLMLIEQFILLFITIVSENVSSTVALFFLSLSILSLKFISLMTSIAMIVVCVDGGN